MRKDRGKFSPPVVGASSLLVIFAVLCLTVFALLSLATVRADMRLSDASAKGVEDYYAADGKAEETLARLRRGETPEGVEVSPGDAEGGYTRYCRYTVPISDTQELRVWVALGDEEYRVLQWQSAPVGEWEPDEALHVWSGEREE